MSTPRPGTSPAAPAAEKLGWTGLLRARGFGRLLAVRSVAQWGDGMFQAALGGAVLFNPEREADPLAVAAGLAVLLLPYSLVGPFAGALLDRWDRRRVLVVANLLRAVLTLGVALIVDVGGAGAPLYLAALAVAGVSRFGLAGLSAALPHVVTRRHPVPRPATFAPSLDGPGADRLRCRKAGVRPVRGPSSALPDDRLDPPTARSTSPDGALIEANVVVATAGAAVAALGGATAIGARALVGAGDTGSALTTAVAAAGPVLAAALAAGFAPGLLGPDRTDEADRTLVAVARGLVDGARATARTPTVAAAFLALATHRLSFGVTTLLTLVLYRHTFTGAGVLRAGIAGVGEAVACAAAGLGMAALLTPWLAHRLGRPRTVRAALLTAAVTQLALAAWLTQPGVLAAAFLLSLAGQVVKLCADAAVQSEVGDETRGRVFALYDTVFNVCYVLAIAVAALLVPADGRAPWLVAATAGVYVLGLLAHDRRLRHARRGPVGSAGRDPTVR